MLSAVDNRSASLYWLYLCPKLLVSARKVTMWEKKVAWGAAES
jgi:hypothetical protein